MPPKKPSKAATPKAPQGCYWASHTTRGGAKADVLWFKVREKQPKKISRSIEIVTDEHRYERRPSLVAKRGGGRTATDVLFADTFVGNCKSWKEPAEMPDERKKEDTGWLPGPILDRGKEPALPAFNGPKPGPTNVNLTHESSNLDIMDEILTPRFKACVRKHTITHAEKWRKEHPDWKNNTIETAFASTGLGFLGEDHQPAVFACLFDMWLVARLKVAQLKPEMPAMALWGKFKPSLHLHDVELDSMITYNQYVWCNRHMSFADTNENEEDDEEEEGEEEEEEEPTLEDGESDSDPEDDDVKSSDDEREEPTEAVRDTHRKRREATNIFNEDQARAYNPFQHLGYDDGVRTTKHWDKIRIRYKASVHSGSIVFMLNDCKTHFCIYLEEANWWSKKRSGDEHINSFDNRLKRAGAVLQAKSEGLDGVIANYCISIDRGIADIAAAASLKKMGIYTNSIVMTNRIGLPRQYINEVKRDLQYCPRGCTHQDEPTCRRFMWTVLNKDGFELTLWQDAKLIVSYGNFFSGTRAGEICRGGHRCVDSYRVWIPESPWHYNVEGRSATDGADQSRRKLAMAERRILRAGLKGMTFIFDVAFTNGHALWKMLAPKDIKRSKLDNEYTKVRP